MPWVMDLRQCPVEVSQEARLDNKAGFGRGTRNHGNITVPYTYLVSEILQL